MLVRHLMDELASFRRRALAAEAELRSRDDATVASEPAPPPVRLADDGDRVAALERENAELRRRLDEASVRTRTLLERVRFLRQQHGIGGAA